MQKNIDIENEIVEQLKKEHDIEELVSFSDIDIQERIKNNAFLIVRYRELYNKELQQLEKIEILLDKLIGERYKYYRFEDEKEWDKTEIKNYCIPSDSKVIKMKQILQKQKIRVRFFETCFKGLEHQGWRIKTWIDRERGY